MNEPGGTRSRIVVLSRWWRRQGGEEPFVVRSVAAALSRHHQVDVLVPGAPESGGPDGLFDVAAVGLGDPGAEWPEPAVATWPEGPNPAGVVVEGGDAGAYELAARFAPGTPVFVVTPAGDRAGAAGAAALVPSELGLHVPISPLAAERPHNGFGFTGYVLVLSDGSGNGEGPPTALGAWLAARFPDRHLVVVEDAVASAWRLRSLRGRVHVDTRTDLQRLLAHARVVVDLAPGPLVARECVESLRFGTPVVVPAGTAAAELAAATGGLWFRDVPELLGCVEALVDGDLRDRLGARGRCLADERHGRPEHFVGAVESLVVVSRRRPPSPAVP